MKKQNKHIPRGIWRVCAGIVEMEQVLPPQYQKAIAAAELAVGKNYTSEAEAERQKLVQAVKSNLINQKTWSYELLCRHYGLPIDKNRFNQEKMTFCWTLGKALELI